VATRDFFPEVQRLERNVDHLPQSNAEVKNRWNYTTIPYTIIASSWTILHLTVLEINIANSLILTNEFRGEITEKTGRLKVHTYVVINKIDAVELVLFNSLSLGLLWNSFFNCNRNFITVVSVLSQRMTDLMKSITNFTPQ
jgi:hypothetical protein